MLILHAWAGRSAFECNRARALAARGYAAFAADLFGRGVLGSGPAENAALMQPFLDDRARLQGRLKVAIACFTRQPETGNAYSETADRRSWQSLLNFLEEAVD